MAADLARFLGPSPIVLVVAVLADLAIGDPAYRLHPVRLMGGALSALEQRLRTIGADGYGGGIALFVILSVLSVAVTAAAIALSLALAEWAAWAVHVFILYSLLALGDLLKHIWRVEAALARDDLVSARSAVAQLVARDTGRMDAAACRRTAIESLSENLTDGFVSAVFWYLVAGLPAVVVFKVVSTMDSMVGYKTPLYLRFGWCGARLDDVMNYLPARLTWLLIAMVAGAVPRCSLRKALAFGWRQHALLPSPNSGWSEAATAGAIQRRLVGPIWKQGELVTELWLGDPADPPAATELDVTRAITVNVGAGLAATALCVGVLLLLRFA